MEIEDKDIEAYIGFPFTDTSEYNANDLRKATKASYLEGKREATRDWAWWKDGTQYVGTCGNTLAQALDIIAEEEYQNG